MAILTERLQGRQPERVPIAVVTRDVVDFGRGYGQDLALAGSTPGLDAQLMQAPPLPAGTIVPRFPVRMPAVLGHERGSERQEACRGGLRSSDLAHGSCGDGGCVNAAKGDMFHRRDRPIFPAIFRKISALTNDVLALVEQESSTASHSQAEASASVGTTTLIFCPSRSSSTRSRSLPFMP